MTNELLADFHSQNTFQLGEFTLKSGVLSPIYVDLRVLISSPTILEKTAKALCEAIKNAELEFDYVVGVPYGAIMIATLISVALNKPMLLKRKEAKAHGKKQMIDGHFEPGKKVLIIEDVVTSGASVLETVEELRKVDLICEHIFCVLDREQGGVDRLRSEDISLHSIVTMGKILDYLVTISLIDESKKAEIQKALKGASATSIPTGDDGKLAEQKNGSSLNDPEVCRRVAKHACGVNCGCGRERDNADGDVVDWRLSTRTSSRLSLLAKNPLNKRVVDIIFNKKTNLCLAVDYETTEEILSTVEKAKESICALKLHYDIIKDFSQEFISQLHLLANNSNFVIFEDRKFADTGKTMELQLSGGPTPISGWADLVTVHSVAGSPSVAALKSIVGKEGVKVGGCLLIAELSTEDNLTTLDGYVEGTVRIAKENSRLVSGFICQKRCSDDPSFLYWTPGVNLSESSDDAGQKWRSVEQAIVHDLCDIIVVGRGVSAATDVAAAARRYAKAGWEALVQRDRTLQ